MRKYVVLTVALASLATAGCATLLRGAFTEPVVNLRDVRLQGLGLNGGNLDVILSVYNPNSYRLDATQLTYRLVVDDVTFADGNIMTRTSVGQRDSTFITIPVNFTFAGIGAAGRQIINTGAVSYRITGDIGVGTPAGSFTVPYSSTGRFSAFGGVSRE
jgi:LEA14-like dessication related protein